MAKTIKQLLSLIVDYLDENSERGDTLVYTALPCQDNGFTPVSDAIQNTTTIQHNDWTSTVTYGDSFSR